MSTHTLIGLVGYAGAGKDTACRALGATRCAFADALKAKVDPLFPADTPKEIKRPAYVAYGAAMRKIDPDHWVKAIEIPDAALVCVTDVRYPNEAAFIEARGGKLVLIERDGVGPANEEEYGSIREVTRKHNPARVKNHEGEPGLLASELAATFGPRRAYFRALRDFGCPWSVARVISSGTTFAATDDAPTVYVAGGMRGYDKFNFPAFDAARDQWVAKGYNVISPADIDRHSGVHEGTPVADVVDSRPFVFRDFWAIYFLAMADRSRNGIVLLPGWERSTGAKAEQALAKWLGLNVWMDGAGTDLRAEVAT